jgi:Flp pilus assembly protein TadG
MRALRRGPGLGRRGSVLVFTAVALVALLAAAALAIDLGMLLDTRQDAQRAADAAALAGASAFQGATGTAAIPDARNKALQFAAKNLVRGVAVDTVGAANGNTAVTTYTSNEAQVWIFPATSRVRVRIRRAAVTTWLAKVFGKQSIPIAAWATAEASNAGGATCVRPFAVPDLWKETNAASDPNANHVWDSNESWSFDPGAGDTYEAYNPNNPTSPTGTGYGTVIRNSTTGVVDDFGTPMIIKEMNPTDQLSSGFFFPFQIGNDPGANAYKNNITGCNPATTYVGVPYQIQTGDMVGPTKQGIDNLISQDPSAVWVPPHYTNGALDPGTGIVTGSNQANWTDSPRVIKIALFDPNQVAGLHGGSVNITFNNIALMFLEGFQQVGGNPNKYPLVARFLYYAKGTGGGPVTGPLVKVLRLVE